MKHNESPLSAFPQHTFYSLPHISYSKNYFADVIEGELTVDRNPIVPDVRLKILFQILILMVPQDLCFTASISVGLPFADLLFNYRSVSYIFFH